MPRKKASKSSHPLTRDIVHDVGSSHSGDVLPPFSPLRSELESCPDNEARALGLKTLARLETEPALGDVHLVECLIRYSRKVG